MKVEVIYHNEPHAVHVHGLRLVPVSGGVWFASADLSSWQGIGISMRGSDGDGGGSVFFSDDATHGFPLMRVQIRFIPEVASERGPHIVDRLCKGGYEAVLISAGSFWRLSGRSRAGAVRVGHVVGGGDMVSGG